MDKQDSELIKILNKHSNGIGHGSVGGHGILWKYDHDSDTSNVPSALIAELAELIKAGDKEAYERGVALGFEVGRYKYPEGEYVYKHFEHWRRVVHHELDPRCENEQEPQND